jgi:hypothetical protein
MASTDTVRDASSPADRIRAQVAPLDPLTSGLQHAAPISSRPGRASYAAAYVSCVVGVVLGPVGCYELSVAGRVSCQSVAVALRSGGGMEQYRYPGEVSGTRRRGRCGCKLLPQPGATPSRGDAGCRGKRPERDVDWSGRVGFKLGQRGNPA